jgi:hypothetical protein
MNAPKQPTLPGFEPTALERAQRDALETDKADEHYERLYGRLQSLQDEEDAAAGLLDDDNRG